MARRPMGLRPRAIEAGEESKLAKRWREHGDEEAERRLIVSQLRLVVKMAWGSLIPG